ncbi:ArsR/SmtB family transcription factor [Acetohalobium arabaticum]|uniref:Transcriptional regulator, ArsR family n=1 Tax=Acetohalobium arabaticum (strain ATCC 49924 / DSM 5501 / Z-7288) TaxID=574087 RepID=D9QT26_ACEAZ|nr:metalloregulator ArsR/SmtB family transcription factor [Acetohalobium arabaticum]ADL13526.1 transcriptional regulator, ArsR family [Acetohalobium arabaticum DSM 5501]
MEKIAETTELFKALSDERRLKIVDLLACCGKLCVCDVTEELGLSQPNISHHLKILKNAGLIKATKRGRWVDYELNHDKVEEFKDSLDFITAKQPGRYDCTKSDC